MEQLRKFNFLIIDDSPFDCLIAEKIIQSTRQHLTIKSYTDPSAALNFISNAPVTPGDPKTVVLLDLQMPVMDGFEFIETYERLPVSTRDSYVILLTTSSVNQNDIVRGSSYDSVRFFINKPLTISKLMEVFSDI